MTQLIMEINDFKSINNAKIEINKINVVGGVNGSGKSTVSRIFYSFLKANSIQRKDFILKGVINKINKLLDILNFESNEYDLHKYLTINDDLQDICHILNSMQNISKDYDIIANIKKEEFLKEFNSFKERLINDGIDIDNLENKFYLNFDSDFFLTRDYVDYFFEEYDLNLNYLDDYLRLKYLWNSFQHYRFNVYDECLNIYSEIDEFLISDDPSISEKIFNRILLKEHISVNDFDFKVIMHRINQMINILNFGENRFELPNHLSVEDNFSDFIKTFNVILEISKNHDKLANVKKNELKKELLAKFESIIKILISKNLDVSDIENALYSTNDDMYTDSLFFVYSIFEEYNLNLDYSDDYRELDNLVDSYNYYNSLADFYDSCVAIELVMHEFFDEDILLRDDPTINELLLNKKYFNNNNISFNMFYGENDSFNYFFNNFINSVYYVDNVSIFDINHEKMVLTNRVFHMDELIEDVYGDTYTYDLNEDFNDIMDKIDKIIKGRYKQNFPNFVSDKKNDPLTFIKSYSMNVETSNVNTPSGVKQIGIVQLLLLNDKLKKDGYLIIDEPEVNLHPDWQLKFAEILVLLAKDLNITIYLNSHSPMFIEAIDAFSEYYDMEDDVNYYLTEESEIEGKYNFTKINSDELYRIYDNLGNAYDLIDQLRLRKHLGE